MGSSRRLVTALKTSRPGLIGACLVCTAAVRGVPAAGAASVPDSLVFGSVAVGTAATRMLTVTNADTIAIRIAIAVENGQTAFSAPTDSFDLARGRSTNVAVDFKPVREGDFHAVLTVKEEGLAPAAQVTLRGVGLIPTARIAFESNPTGRAIAVDGSTHTMPVSFSWKEGSSHDVSVDRIQGDEETRHLFSGWSDGKPRARKIEVADATTYKVDFGTEHFLSVRSPRGEVVGEGWYSAGQQVRWSVVSSPLPDATEAGTRHRARQKSAAVSMDGPRTVEVTWDAEHHLEVQTHRGSVEGAGWYEAGARAEWNVRESPVADATEPGTRYRARKLASSVLMNGPDTVEVAWGAEHFLTVESGRSSVAGAGWYEAGSDAEWRVQESPVAHATEPGTRYQAVETSGSLRMDGPAAVEVEWYAEHLLTVNTPFSAVEGSGWHKTGEEVGWRVAEPIVTDAASGTRQVAEQESGAALMDRPETVDVEWKEQYRLIKGVTPAAAGRLDREISGQAAAETDTLWLAPGTEVTLIPSANDGYCLFRLEA